MTIILRRDKGSALTHDEVDDNFDELDGRIGAQGAQGPQGPAGADSMVAGPQGAQGSAGAQGSQGTAGTQGAQGAAGAQGAVGAQGATGSAGAQGSTGAQGAQGATGAQGSAGAGSTQPLQCLRLYATTAVPVPVSDTTTVSTIYVGPYNGNVVTLLDGSDNYANFTLTEISLALSSLTSGKPYDVFVYNNSGTLTIELSAAWTNDTTRADALATVKGLVVKSGDHTRLHVGTIYTTGTTSTADTAAKRYMWNRYNQRTASMANATETADTWTNGNNATWAQANSNTANQLDYVTGDASTTVLATVAGAGRIGTSSTTNIGANIGVDSSTAIAGVGGTAQATVANQLHNFNATYTGQPGLGRHTLRWIDLGSNGVTVTYFGDGGASATFQSGIRGSLQN